PRARDRRRAAGRRRRGALRPRAGRAGGARVPPGRALADLREGLRQPDGPIRARLGQAVPERRRERRVRRPARLAAAGGGGAPSIARRGRGPGAPRPRAARLDPRGSGPTPSGLVGLGADPAPRASPVILVMDAARAAATTVAAGRAALGPHR